MPAYKDKEKGTWYASFYYEDWTGKKVKKLKRGFSIKRDALEWERTFLQQQTADLEMTFATKISRSVNLATKISRSVNLDKAFFNAS